MTARCTNTWVPRKFLSPWVRPRLLFPKFVMGGLLFRSILRMCVQNLKFAALPVPEIIGGAQMGSPWIRPRSFFSQIFNGLLVPMDPMNVPAKFEVRGFTRSWDNRGVLKKLGSHYIRLCSIFSKFLMSFCSHGPSEYICQIWSS